MANVDNPRGLTPLMSGNNASSIRIKHYYASVTTAIFQGDIVCINAAGRVHSLTTAAGDVEIRGVAAQYNAALTTPSVRIAVYDDPDTLFEINSDGTTDPTLATALGHISGTADLAIGSGSTSTGLSAMELDYSLIGTTTTDPVFIEGVSGRADNDPALMHGDYVVRLTRHIAKGGTLAAK